MGRKHTYATKSQLETLVRRMHTTGILYYEALEEFKKQFILVVLRDVNWNKSKTAEYWACTEALWFAAFESCTSTIALSAMPNAVRRMALAHRGRTETWDDSLGNESARSLLSRLPQNLKEEICPPLPGIVARLRSSTHERPQSVINLRVFLPAKGFTLLH